MAVRRRNRRAVTLQTQALAQPLFITGFDSNVVAPGVMSVSFSTEVVSTDEGLGFMSSQWFYYGFVDDGFGGWTLSSFALQQVVFTSATTADLYFTNAETADANQGFAMVWFQGQQLIRGREGQTLDAAILGLGTAWGGPTCMFANLVSFP